MRAELVAVFSIVATLTVLAVIAVVWRRRSVRAPSRRLSQIFRRTIFRSAEVLARVRVEVVDAARDLRRRRAELGAEAAVVEARVDLAHRADAHVLERVAQAGGQRYQEARQARSCRQHEHPPLDQGGARDRQRRGASQAARRGCPAQASGCRAARCGANRCGTAWGSGSSRPAAFQSSTPRPVPMIGPRSRSRTSLRLVGSGLPPTAFDVVDMRSSSVFIAAFQSLDVKQWSQLCTFSKHFCKFSFLGE